MTKSTKLNQVQDLVWLDLSARAKPRGEQAGKKDGLRLPNSVTEDVGGISLMPHYSAKQQRSIARRRKGRKEMIRSARRGTQ